MITKAIPYTNLKGIILDTEEVAVLYQAQIEIAERIGSLHNANVAVEEEATYKENLAKINEYKALAEICKNRIDDIRNYKERARFNHRVATICRIMMLPTFYQDAERIAALPDSEFKEEKNKLKIKVFGNVLK